MVTALRALARPAAATGIGIVLLSLLRLGGENPMIEVPMAIVTGAAMGMVANYWGLLALYALLVAANLTQSSALALSTTPWYAVYSWFALIALVATAIQAFRTTVAPYATGAAR